MRSLFRSLDYNGIGIGTRSVRALVCLALVIVSGCVGYPGAEIRYSRHVITPVNKSAASNGFVVGVDSLTCCEIGLEGEVLVVPMSFRNTGKRPVAISSFDVLLFDTDGRGVSAGESSRIDQKWATPAPSATTCMLYSGGKVEVLELGDWGGVCYERTDAVVNPGAEVMILARFHNAVSFEKLSSIQVRNFMGAKMVEIPLAMKAK